MSEVAWYAKGEMGDKVRDLTEYYIYGPGCFGPDGAPNWGQLQADLYKMELSMSEVWEVMNQVREEG